jgi:23S rRNA pseudouridine1911/1915/1917 synthase
VLAAAFADLSRARVQRLIADAAVMVNGAPVRKSGQLAAGDHVVVTIERHAHVAPAAAPELPILWEDEALVAIDKPAGLAVHGAPGDSGPSVAGWFLHRYPEAASHFEAERPGIVHRLDKDTTGVLLLAKTPAAQAALSAAFEERRVSKRYLAICEGVPSRPRALIEAPIGRHPQDRLRMVIAKQGREARTEYEVLASGSGQSLLLVHLYTGRTHQIRVHLQAIGTPVVYDAVYGKGGAGRQQLHAWQTIVPHPAGGELRLTAPLPADMRETLSAMPIDLAPYTVGEARRVSASA